MADSQVLSIEILDIVMQYAPIKIIARAFMMVPIRTHANNCFLGTIVYRKLSFLMLTFFILFYYGEWKCTTSWRVL